MGPLPKIKWGSKSMTLESVDSHPQPGSNRRNKFRHPEHGKQTSLLKTHLLIVFPPEARGGIFFLPFLRSAWFDSVQKSKTRERMGIYTESVVARRTEGPQIPKGSSRFIQVPADSCTFSHLSESLDIFMKSELYTSKNQTMANHTTFCPKSLSEMVRTFL